MYNYVLEDLFMNNIDKRISNRTYTGEKLSYNIKTKINSYISDKKNYNSIYQSPIRFELIEQNLNGKIGTYGIIKNAPAFIVMIAENNKYSMLDCGFVFERFILYLTSLDLGTCWLGSSFGKNRVPLEKKLKENEFIPIASPVGKVAVKPSMIDKTVRAMSKSRSRLDFDKLFFLDKYNKPIIDKDLRDKLKLVQLAPSANNKQPWRIIIKDDKAYFFIHRNKTLQKVMNFDIQYIDMGIAIYHYYKVFNKCCFIKKRPKINVPSNWEFVIGVS